MITIEATSVLAGKRRQLKHANIHIKSQCAQRHCMHAHCRTNFGPAESDGLWLMQLRAVCGGLLPTAPLHLLL